jgi:hypothetical protein
MIPLDPLRPPTTAPVFVCYRYATALQIAPATAMLPPTIALPTFPPTPPQAVVGSRARIPTGVQDRLRWRSARSQTPPRGRRPSRQPSHATTPASGERSSQNSRQLSLSQAPP